MKITTSVIVRLGVLAATFISCTPAIKELPQIKALAYKEQGKDNAAIDRIAEQIKNQGLETVSSKDLAAVIRNKKIDWRVRYLFLVIGADKNNKVKLSPKVLSKIVKDKNENNQIRAVSALLLLGTSDNKAKQVLKEYKKFSIDEVGLIFDNLGSFVYMSANDWVPDYYAWPAGYRPLLKPFTKHVLIDGKYKRGFFVLLNYSKYSVDLKQEPYLRILNEEGDITIGVDRKNKIVLGYAQKAGLFAIAMSPVSARNISVLDIYPPFTEIALTGGATSRKDDGFQISTTTSISLSSADDRTGDVKTYYTLNMSEDLFALGLQPLSLKYYDRYASSFTLKKGVYWIGYGAIDESKNYELLKTTTFYVVDSPR